MVRDLLGREMTEDQARLEFKRGMKGPKSRASLIAARQERGLHPHNGLPVLDNGERCGSCAHLMPGPSGYSKRWYKCALTSSFAYGSPTTDIRVRWPACEKWQAR